MKRIIAIGLAVIGIAAVAGCGSSDDGSDGSNTTENTAAAEDGTTAEAATSEAPEAEPYGDEPTKDKQSAATIRLGDSQFGDVLFGGENDQAIYLFTNDKQDTSNCSGDCAAAWPPVLTSGEPKVMGGVDRKLLSTTKRDDGETQVTYNGHPLYYYVNEGPNEVRCSDVSSFGGIWFAVTPSGDQV